jgi:hypothetical protein
VQAFLVKIWVWLLSFVHELALPLQTNSRSVFKEKKKNRKAFCRVTRPIFHAINIPSNEV